MAVTQSKTPGIAWFYGVLGLAPFIGAAGADLLRLAPGQAWWSAALAVYGAVILSFLGGGRWGMELSRDPVRASVISLSMAPSIAGFLLLLVPAGHRSLTLYGLALAHALQWLWDVRAKDLPVGYGALRTALTAGVMVCLLAAAAFG